MKFKSQTKREGLDKIISSTMQILIRRSNYILKIPSLKYPSTNHEIKHWTDQGKLISNRLNLTPNYER